MTRVLFVFNRLIPFGSNNKFRIPVVISLWGAPDKKAQALAVLTSHYISVDSSPVKKASSVCGLGLGTSSGHGQADYGHVVSQRTFVSPKEVGVADLYKKLVIVGKTQD